jgi:hypothetical protein
MRPRYLNQLIQDQPVPLLWAITAQPVDIDGWRETAKLADGACYAKVGTSAEVVFRGISDGAGRRWMVLSAVGCSPTMKVARELREMFFPERAIVAVSVGPDPSPMLEMWWSVDGDGLPLDEGWRAVMAEVSGDAD